MINFDEALKKANEYHKHLCVVRSAELNDSWVFTMGSLVGETAYGPKPIRVMKDDGEAHEWDTMKYHKEFKEKFLREIELK